MSETLHGMCNLQINELSKERDALKAKLESEGKAHGFALATNIELGKQLKAWRSVAEGLAEALRTISNQSEKWNYGDEDLCGIAKKALERYNAAKRGTK